MLFLHSFTQIYPLVNRGGYNNNSSVSTPSPRVKTWATLGAKLARILLQHNSCQHERPPKLARVLHGVNLGPQPQMTHVIKCKIHVDRVCVPVQYPLAIASIQRARLSTVCPWEFMCNIYACNLHGQASQLPHRQHSNTTRGTTYVHTRIQIQATQ